MAFQVSNKAIVYSISLSYKSATVSNCYIAIIFEFYLLVFYLTATEKSTHRPSKLNYNYTIIFKCCEYLKYVSLTKREWIIREKWMIG